MGITRLLPIPVSTGPSGSYATSISVTMDENYVLSVQLIDQDGNPLGSEQTVDLPLESVVVGGSYDSDNQQLILTLDNGNTIEIPISGLISGLQAEITSQNPLSADLLADGQTNKVFTATEQTKLSNIEAGAQVNVKPDWDAQAGTAAEILHKPTIPTVNDGTVTITQDGQTLGTFTVNQSGNTTIDIPAASGENDWYGTQAEFDALPTKDVDTNYFISDKIDYSEIANTPTFPTKVSQLQNDIGYALKWKVDKDIYSAIKEYDSKTKWVTAAEYAAMELAGTLEDGVAYHIEGPQTAIQMVVTFTDQSTATYDVYVGAIN